MQNCSVPRAPCCPLTRGPTAPRGGEWVPNASGRCKLCWGWATPDTVWGGGAAPAPRVGAKCECLGGPGRQSQAGRSETPQLVPCSPRGSLALLKQQDGPGEQFSSCHPALLLQHWAPPSCAGRRGKRGAFWGSLPGQCVPGRVECQGWLAKDRSRKVPQNHRTS